MTVDGITTRHDLVYRLMESARRLDEVGNGEFRRYFAQELDLIQRGTNTVVYDVSLDSDQLRTLVEIAGRLIEAATVAEQYKERGRMITWKQACHGAGNCAQVGLTDDGRVALRSTANPGVDPQIYTTEEWDGFIEQVKAGKFDRAALERVRND